MTAAKAVRVKGVVYCRRKDSRKCARSSNYVNTTSKTRTETKLLAASCKLCQASDTNVGPLARTALESSSSGIALDGS